AVIQIVQPAPHLQPDAEVGVVVKVGARRHDPIDKSRPHERNDRGHANARGSHCPGEAHSHGDIIGKHLLREELARLAKPRRVVGSECLVDEIDDRNMRIDGRRFDALSVQETTFLHRKNILPDGVYSQRVEVHSFHIQLTTVWLDATQLAKVTSGTLKGNMQRAAEDLLPQSVEKVVTVKEIRARRSAFLLS